MSATSSRVQGLLDRTRKLKAGGSLPTATVPQPVLPPPTAPPQIEEKIEVSTKTKTFAAAPGPASQPAPDLGALMRTLNIAEPVKISPSTSPTPPLSFRSIEPRMSRARKPKSSQASSRSSSGSSQGRRLRSPFSVPKATQVTVSMADTLRAFERKAQEYLKQQGGYSEQLQKMVQDQLSVHPPDDRIRIAEETFKHKAKVLLETVRNEAIEMDRKFSELQAENSRLRDQLQQSDDDKSPGLNESRISNKSAMSYIRTEARKDLSSFDFEEVLAEIEALGANEKLGLDSLDDQVTETIERVQSSFSDLSVFLSKHLLEEQGLRLRVEEETSKQIEERESLIASWEQQVKVLGSMDSVQTSRLMQSEQEEPYLNMQDPTPARKLGQAYLRQLYDNVLDQVPA